MNPIIRKTISAGMVLAASAAFAAEVVVDDFTGTNPGQNMLPDGGAWLADADTWPAIGGSSRVIDAVEGTDLVKGETFAGDNIAKAYGEDGTITSKIYVTKDVSTVKKWAYAGWVMDFITPLPKAEDTAGGKQIYDLESWKKGNEVNVAGCDFLEITMQFDENRMIWVDLFSPSIEFKNALAPQYGWRYTGTGLMETKKFSLKGITGPAQKWKDDVNKVAYNPYSVTRIRWLYEGMLKGSPTASYDTLGHLLKIKKVALSGANCAVVPNRYSSTSTGIVARSAASRAGSSFTAANGSLNFRDLTAETKVTVRNLAGNVVAEGSVNGAQSSMDVSALKNGVYMVSAVAGKVIRSGSITVLK